MKKEEYQAFLDLKLENYIYNNVLGSDDFSQSITELDNNIKNVLNECIRIILDNEETIPSYLIQIIDQNIATIKAFLNSIEDIVKKWPSSNSNLDKRREITQERNAVNMQIRDYISTIYFQRTTQGNQSASNLLSVIAFIKTIDKKSIKIIDDINIEKNNLQNIIKEIDTTLKDYEVKVKNANDLMGQVTKKVAERVIYDYSNIFAEEATKHSHYDIKDKIKKFGTAEIWLFVGILMTAILFAFIIFMYEFFPTLSKGELDYPNLVTKISLISILIFIVTFSFKQYSINKHLYTVNKHRENVLNSYKLFLNSISEDDTNIRNVLMAEVAKAIYEQSKTGYINEKDGETGSPSILSLQNYLPKDKGV